jgi:hypothetical protein
MLILLSDSIQCVLSIFNFKPESNFPTAKAASKNKARVKSGQNQNQNNHLANLDLNP